MLMEKKIALFPAVLPFSANPKLKAEIGDPWATLAAIQPVRRALAPAYSYEEGRAGLGSHLFGYARAIARAAAF